MTDTDGQKDLQ